MAKLKKGINDLGTTYPEIAAEWDYERNTPLTPQDVTAGSGREVWWLCSKGHSWKARISSRVQGNGCPFCAGKRPIAGETDLATLYPEIAAEWDYERNAPLTPQDVTAKSHKKVWWLCSKGHSWEAPVSNRTNVGSGCPYCCGRLAIVGETDLATLRPDLVAEWDYERNAPLTPQDVTEKSSKKIWWICSKGHSWQAPPARRASGAGCPFCAGRSPIVGETDLATTYPDLAAEWDYERNTPLTPQNVTAGSNRAVHWICSKGHRWKATINSRTHGVGCPYCAGRKPIVGETDLATLYPKIAAEWDYERNAPLTPEDVTAGSSKKVWWTCSEEHHWQVSPLDRTTGDTACPYCWGSKRNSIIYNNTTLYI